MAGVIGTRRTTTHAEYVRCAMIARLTRLWTMIAVDKLGFGRKMERLVMDRWVWKGFTCWQPPRAKYTGQDIFELFDFIAVKPWCPVNFVQVKRSRAKEAAAAFDAIKAFADHYHAPVALFVVLWRKERRTERISFRAWEYTLVGWVFAGEWTDE